MNKGLIHYIIYTRDKNLPKERSVSDVNSPKLVGIDPVRWLLVGGQIYNFKSVKSIISNFKPAKLYFEKNLTYFQIFSSGCSSSLTSHYEHCTWMKEARSIRTNDWTMKDVFGIKRVNLCGDWTIYLWADTKDFGDASRQTFQSIKSIYQSNSIIWLFA